MEFLLEENFAPYFRSFLDLRERIVLRQLCKLGKRGAPQEDGIEARGLTLCESESSPPRGIEHFFCQDCKYLFKDLRAHFGAFPHHAEIIAPQNFVSWSDSTMVLAVAGDDLLARILNCSWIRLLTLYGLLSISDISRRGRGWDMINVPFREKYTRTIYLNNRAIFIIDGKLYIRLRFKKIRNAKLAAVISVQTGPAANIPATAN